MLLIARFYLVDRGLRHRLPGVSSLDRPGGRPVGAPGSGTNGHAAVVALRGGPLVCGVGSIGLVPTGHIVAY